MSACWIGASISYQPHGIDQVIVGHDGRIEDMERTLVPKNKNGEHLYGTMKAQRIMTTSTAMIWVPHPNVLVYEVAPNITAVLHPNPLVEEVAANTMAVLHPNLLVEEVAASVTAVLNPNPLVKEVAASTTGAANMVRQQIVRIGTHQQIHGKRIGVLRIGVQIHGMRTRRTKILARIHRMYTRIIGIRHGDH